MEWQTHVSNSDSFNNRNLNTREELLWMKSKLQRTLGLAKPWTLSKQQRALSHCPRCRRPASLPKKAHRTSTRAHRSKRQKPSRPLPGPSERKWRRPKASQHLSVAPLHPWSFLGPCAQHPDFYCIHVHTCSNAYVDDHVQSHQCCTFFYLPEVLLEISNSELNTFYLDLLIIIFIVHKNGVVFHSNIKSGRKISQPKAKKST